MEGSLAERLGESPGQKTTDVFKEPRSHCLCMLERAWQKAWVHRENSREHRLTKENFTPFLLFLSPSHLLEGSQNTATERLSPRLGCKLDGRLNLDFDGMKG